MHDFGQRISKHSISVAILQELWAVNDCVRGLPVDMRVLAVRRSIKAAVFINDARLDCICFERLTNE